MSIITALQLAAICQTAEGQASASTFAPLLNTAMATWSINTPERAALFIANILVESKEFQRLEDAGSTDNFKRRGLLPLLGSDDYIACGASLGIDLENSPELLLVSANAVNAACWRWTQQNHNQYADSGAAVLSARALITTSYDGFASFSQTAYYKIACKELGAFVITPPADPDAVAGNTGPSTSIGFLRWVRDKLYAIAPSSWLVVGGKAAVGEQPTANPVHVAGVDEGNLKRSLLTDAKGRLSVVMRYGKRENYTEASLQGRASIGFINCPAVSAKYSSVQIWNPPGNDKVYSVGFVGGYNSSGTMRWFPIWSQTPLANPGGAITPNDPTQPPAAYQMRYENLAAKTAYAGSGMTVSATMPQGGQAQVSNQVFIVRPGWGLAFEGETANIAMSANMAVLEIPISEIV